VRAALEALNPADIARTIGEGKTVHLSVDEEAFELEPEDVLIEAREREGYAAMASDGFVVALDTELTPDLIREWWARELVRRMNDWRKAAGFDIQDRIRVRYKATPELEHAVREFGDYIARETLATSLESAPLDGKGFQGDASFGDQRIQVELTRA
jgi:isoleucyl-tRNA synthetase